LIITFGSLLWPFIRNRLEERKAAAAAVNPGMDVQDEDN